MAGEEQATQMGGSGIMISYQELVTIRTQIEGMRGMLQSALALQGRVDSMDRRLGKVENALSGKSGERRVWNTLFAFFGGAGTMALGGWAMQYIPRLMGWH